MMNLMSIIKKQQIPMKRYAAKFIILPIIPAHSYWFFQIVPKGAAILVTKEIIAKMKHIVTIATMFDFFCVI